MVKLKKPLFSKSASGTLANAITYIYAVPTACAKFKQKKPIAKTSTQVLLRDLFKEAAALAKELSPEEKDYYASLNPNSAACPWWNNFIGEYIKDHWPVSADVNSYTRKREPSIADLQALHSFIRVKDDFTVTDAGTQDIDIYTVPSGYVFKQEAISCYCNSGDPYSIAYMLRYGEVDVVYYSEVYGAAWGLHISTTPISYDQLEKVRIQFTQCEIDNVLYWNLFGYLTNKY